MPAVTDKRRRRGHEVVEEPAGDDDGGKGSKRARTDPIEPAGPAALVVADGTAAPSGVRRTSRLPAPTMLLEGHGAAVLALDFSPGGAHVVSGSVDKTLMLWHLASGGCSSTALLEGHLNAVTCARWAPDGESVVSGSADRTVRAWDVETGAQVKRLREHTGVVNTVSPARKGPPLVVSGADDCSAKLWDLRVRKSVHTLADRYQVLAAELAADGTGVHTAGIEPCVKSWDLRKGAEVEEMRLEGHTEAVTGMRLSPAGTHLLTNGMDDAVRMWDVRPFCKGPRMVREMRGASHGAQKNLHRVAWSGDGRRCAAGSADATVYVWDAESGELQYRLPGHAGSVNDVGFHPTEPVIGSASHDKTIYLGEL